MSHRQIQYIFDEALEQAGPGNQFSGAHILRYAIATLARKVIVGLTSVEAITGRKDFKLAQHYAGVPKDENM